MLNKGIFAAGPAVTGGVELKAIWEVNADPGYNIRKTWKSSGNLIVILTLKGEGVMVLSGLGKVEVCVGNLIIIEQQKLKQYYCAGDNWNFWWFEFNMHGALPFPLQRKITIQPDEEDRKDLTKCKTFMIKTHFTQRAFASAVFCTMLYRWLIEWGGEYHRKSHQEDIERVIAEMHQRLKGFKVAEMARMAFLSERRFRQIFQDLTGKSPKTYYDQVRLQIGEALLRQGICNVTEAAEQLGFSSPFHFSRSFSLHFGHPPSKARRR